MRHAQEAEITAAIWLTGKANSGKMQTFIAKPRRVTFFFKAEQSQDENNIFFSRMCLEIDDYIGHVPDKLDARFENEMESTSVMVTW